MVQTVIHSLTKNMHKVYMCVCSFWNKIINIFSTWWVQTQGLEGNGVNLLLRKLWISGNFRNYMECKCWIFHLIFVSLPINYSGSTRNTTKKQLANRYANIIAECVNHLGGAFQPYRCWITMYISDFCVNWQFSLMNNVGNALFPSSLSQHTTDVVVGNSVSLPPVQCLNYSGVLPTVLFYCTKLACWLVHSGLSVSPN